MFCGREETAFLAEEFWDKASGVRLCSRTLLTGFEWNGELNRGTVVKVGVWARQGKADRAREN